MFLYSNPLHHGRSQIQFRGRDGGLFQINFKNYIKYKKNIKGMAINFSCLIIFIHLVFNINSGISLYKIEMPIKFAIRVMIMPLILSSTCILHMIKTQFVLCLSDLYQDTEIYIKCILYSSYFQHIFVTQIFFSFLKNQHYVKRPIYFL